MPTILIEMDNKMQKLHYGLFVLWMLLCPVTSAVSLQMINME